MRQASMKAERYFYSTAALVMLGITFAAFQPYYLAGEGMSGRQIAPELFALVLVHAIALTGWMVLFLAQALLIDVRSRNVHRKIGWGGAVVALGVTISGCMLAVQSFRRERQLELSGGCRLQHLAAVPAPPGPRGCRPLTPTFGRAAIQAVSAITVMVVLASRD